MSARLPLVATAFVALAVGAYLAAAHFAAGRKLGAAVAVAGPASYRIVLDFPPERFHQTRLQEAGRLVEVRDRTVYMMDVAPAALRRIAGEYWVAAVEPWDGK